MSDTPAGLRWCSSGTCGRLLPLSEFHRVGRGRWPDSSCKACHRVRVREQYRLRYRLDAAFRAQEKARATAAYAARRRAQGRAAA